MPLDKDFDLSILPFRVLHSYGPGTILTLPPYHALKVSSVIATNEPPYFEYVLTSLSGNFVMRSSKGASAFPKQTDEQGKPPWLDENDIHVHDLVTFRHNLDSPILVVELVWETLGVTFYGIRCSNGVFTSGRIQMVVPCVAMQLARDACPTSPNRLVLRNGQLVNTMD